VDKARGLFAVADGVTLSSQGSGAVAAELALDLLQKNYVGNLPEAITNVQASVVRRRDRDKTIGETTLTAAVASGDELQVSNVGDSPAYLFRARGGRENLAEKDKSPYGYITQVIGYPDTIRVHAVRKGLQEGDCVVIASDGVEHVIEKAAFGSLLLGKGRAMSCEGLAERVIRDAQLDVVGYDDDKSVIILRVLPGV
jgi:serine/threonine protein phosphatase PrpC